MPILTMLEWIRKKLIKRLINRREKAMARGVRFEEEFMTI